MEVREDTGSLMLTVSRNVEVSTVDINFNVIVKGKTATGKSVNICIMLLPSERSERDIM